MRKKLRRHLQNCRQRIVTNMAYDVTNIIHTAPMVKLGELITECDLRNSDNTYTLNDVVGISTD